MGRVDIGRNENESGDDGDCQQHPKQLIVTVIHLLAMTLHAVSLSWKTEWKGGCDLD